MPKLGDKETTSETSTTTTKLQQSSETQKVEGSEFHEEERSDSRTSQRSLSPLSVGPIPVPVTTSSNLEYRLSKKGI